MKPIYLLLLVVGATAGALFLFNGQGSTSTASPSTEATAQPAADAATTNQQKNVTQDGVDVTITRVSRTNDSTILELYLSNHEYDLSEDPVLNTARLNNRKPVSHSIISSAMGGHHVEARIVFPTTESGPFEIEPVAGNQFTFNTL